MKGASHIRTWNTFSQSDEVAHVWKRVCPAVRAGGQVQCLSFAIALLLVGSTVFAQTVRYVYDDAGRLIAVTDPSGETAVYTYDATGNVVSITRSSAAVKVLYLSPSSGSVGQAVRILGTGFSSVPSRNTVTFNGTTATIVSAAEGELVANVPVGATTGPVSVTSPSGIASSPEPFTVATSLVPTISGFTPGIGVFATPVTARTSPLPRTTIA